MTRWTVEYDGGGYEEIDAPSAIAARRKAVRRNMGVGRDIIEVRPFAAKPRKRPDAGTPPDITVKPDPFAALMVLKERMEG